MKNRDTELVHRTLDGDDTAFTQLVRKYQKPVHALVWRKIGDFQTAMEEQTWHHVVGTYDGAFMKTYLDGKIFLDGESFVGADPFKAVADTNDEDLRIGCAKGQEQFAFDNGLIDEVAVWRRGLTQSEIRTVMKGNFLAGSPKDKVSTTWGDIKQRAVGK